MKDVEKVGVGVIVKVWVAGGVSVGMVVLVDVNVSVGVRVSVAKNLLIGLSGPASQAIISPTPIRISKPAIMNIKFGLPDFLRLRYELITLAEDDEIGGLLFMD